MKKPLVFWLKAVVLLAVATMVTWQMRKSWLAVEQKNLAIEWRWGVVAVGGFCGSLLTSAVVWRWLASRMGRTGSAGDGLRTLPLLGAYTYSQMGKYIWKVFLILMRVERAGRVGMAADVCVISTLLENVLYMISGGLVGMAAIVRIAGEVDNPTYRVLLWPVTIVVVILLMAACAPPVFYRLVNRVLRGMKRPEIAAERRLNTGALAIAVVAFVPCWCFGGIAMWAAVRCLGPVPLVDCWWFAGAFALSVIIGMASLLPGGAGIRDAAMGAAMALQFSAMGMKHAEAVLMGAAAAVLLRLFQVIAEVGLGVAGMMLTGRRKGAKVGLEGKSVEDRR